MTDWITGIVVYTGNDTKLMQNQQGPRYKQSKLEKEMNKSILHLGLMHIFVCLILCISTFTWYTSTGQSADYLEIATLDY
jgi:phospholipid-translocating ATPase